MYGVASRPEQGAPEGVSPPCDLPASRAHLPFAFKTRKINIGLSAGMTDARRRRYPPFSFITS